MLAHAKKTHLNHSNNPTFIEYDGRTSIAYTGTFQYEEKSNRKIKNVVSGSHYPQTGSFNKVTYISKIGIYDENKNLIAIAKLANPVRKTEERDYTFKMKLDF